MECSGSHPFDYDKQDGESNWYSYRPSEILDHSQVGELSQSSVQSDRIVKKRIVHGEVEFPPYIWNTIPDGTHIHSISFNYYAATRHSSPISSRTEFLHSSSYPLR